MFKLSKVFLAVSLVASAPHVLADGPAAGRYAITTKVTENGVLVSNDTKMVPSGEPAHFGSGKFKVVDHRVTVFCREGWNRWIHFYKPRCDEPVRETSSVPLGFSADITPREGPGGSAILSIAGRFVGDVKDVTIAGRNADLNTANYRDTSWKSTVILKPGQTYDAYKGADGEDTQVTVSVDRK